MGWGALIAAGVALAAQIISSQMEGAEQEDEAEKNKRQQEKAARVNFFANQLASRGAPTGQFSAALQREGIDRQYDQHMEGADGIKARGWVNGGIQAASLLGQGYDTATRGSSYTPSATEKAIDNLGSSMNLAQGASAGGFAPTQTPSLSDPNAMSPTDYLEYQPITGQQYDDETNPLWRRRVGFGNF